MRKSITQFRILEEAAESYLDLFQERCGFSIGPPVPVKSIAEVLLGLRCEVCDPEYLGSDFDGALLTSDGVILTNENHVKNRTRFTIAHEIGHRVLLDFDNFSSGLFFSTERSQRVEHKATLFEQAANRFAGAILMPRTLLRSETRKYTVIDAEAIIALATTFQVSKNAMLVRVQYLTEHLEDIGIPIDGASLARLQFALSRRHSNQQGKKRIRGRSLRQLTFDYLKPFYPGQYGTQYSEAVWFVIGILTRLGVVSFGRNGEIQSARSPTEVLDRPFIIEFAGTPNAGKDSQIEIMSEYFREIRGYKVKVIDEGYRSCPLEGSSHIEKFYWTLLTTAKNLMEAQAQPGKYDVVIFNRGLFDQLAFLHLYRSLDYVSTKKELFFTQFLLNEEWRNLVDVVFLLYVPPDVSLHRESQHPSRAISTLTREFDPPNLPSPPRFLVNEVRLSQLNDCYNYVFQNYGKQFNLVHQLKDVGDMSAERMAVTLMKEIHSELPPSQYFPPKSHLLGVSKSISANKGWEKLQRSFSNMEE